MEYLQSIRAEFLINFTENQTIMIEFESKSITQAIQRIMRENSHISGDILNQAMSRALNHTAQKSKTEANKNIRKIYNISASNVSKHMKVRYSQARTLKASVNAIGGTLSLNNFGAKQVGDKSTTSFSPRGVTSSRLNRKSRSNVIKGVSVAIKKGETKSIAKAFIQIANGGITVFARGKYGDSGFEFAKERMPIGKLTGPSIPSMFSSDEVMKPTENEALTVLESRITHEINWLLSK